MPILSNLGPWGDIDLGVIPLNRPAVMAVTEWAFSCQLAVINSQSANSPIRHWDSHLLRQITPARLYKALSCSFK